MTLDLIQARRLPSKLTGAERAHREVEKAVRRGDLPPADTCECVDCRAPARAYDHRDYGAPLDVEPVCDSCNARRGAARPDPAAVERYRHAVVETESDWRRDVGEPRLIPLELVIACRSFQAAVGLGWDLRASRNMTRATLAERVGIHPPHITDVLSGVERKGQRSLHPDQIADFELAVGNRAVTQFLLAQVGFALPDVAAPIRTEQDGGFS
ncbi:helix-turn-helix transcriptional regulator [Burkholderia gladioli]|uniref:helix-turn-helix domain-containing protein n=1 Tax=Burkholderia gladioli TaxID=28095 RepID=UPI001640B8CE|nr:helix-turn-helix transcriptional regulator [Burkholderia gladioli]MDC6130796.1 helix-turn-helix transcriptional regulator [Burkholderia gladioli]